MKKVFMSAAIVALMAAAVACECNNKKAEAVEEPAAEEIVEACDSTAVEVAEAVENAVEEVVAE